MCHPAKLKNFTKSGKISMSSKYFLARTTTKRSIPHCPIPSHHYHSNSATQPHLTMHLMYTLDNEGKRVYTLEKTTADGEITKSAHPARFSPDDKHSKQRVTLKKRFGILPGQAK